MKYPTTAARLRRAMDSIGIKAQELADKTGIHKSSISQYINGSHTPSFKNAEKIADVLSVSAAWLKGYDIPMRGIPEGMPLAQAQEISIFGDLSMLCYRLNDDDRKRLLSYAEKLYALQQADEELK